jgi:uncharacterized tellurite resistance protein B-like protein
MTKTEKLHETLGELIYVMAMADGKIQPEEQEVIENKLKNHPWAANINWSFNYEKKKQNSIEDLYKKVVNYCEIHGPDKEYQFFIELITEIAEASSGIDENERRIINSFSKDLMDKFSTQSFT